MNKLIIICSLISIISCTHICEEDGLFPDKGDDTSYFECKGGKATSLRCPQSDVGVTYLTFNGTKCVLNRLPRQVARSRYCPSGTAYDIRRGVCRPEKQTKFVPEPYNYVGDNIERYLVRSQEVRSYNCPRGYAYKSTLRKCQRTAYVNTSLTKQRGFYKRSCPNGYVYISTKNKCKRTSYVDPYRGPRQIPKPKYTCPSGFVFVPNLVICRRTLEVAPMSKPVLTDRFRRNGRFETTDSNGHLGEDTWYELPWRWNKTQGYSGQRRILTNTY